MKKLVFLTLALIAGASASAKAEPTPLIVRVIAKDAKFIGTEVGGVAITISDADTGQILAKGLAQGGAGNTAQIMKDSHARRDPLANDVAAKFVANLDLDRPRRITVTAAGPSEPPGGGTTVSATQWVLPGKGVAGGDGWVLEMPGFLVTPHDLPNEIRFADTKSIPLHVKVTMMCGCPVTPDGQWDANKFEILATVIRAGAARVQIPLSYAGKSSEFVGDIPIGAVGDYQIVVTAFDPTDGNTGLAQVILKAL